MLKRVYDTITSTVSPSKTGKQQQQPDKVMGGAPPPSWIKTSYESNNISIPDDFLNADPLDAQPIEVKPVDWENTPIPEYNGHYALILDNVLSPSECATLLDLAQSSVGEASRGEGGSPWRRAMVNVAVGYEVHSPGYRNGDRLIWDNQEIVDRLWKRCLRAPGLAERMARVDEPMIVGEGRYERPVVRGAWFRFVKLNHRMRFLKYSGGEFFRPHRDASYGEEVDGKYHESLFTLHLYLNDSKAEVESADLVGGATPFLSRDQKRRVDVNPKTGRILIFQQRGLLHSGDDVTAGVKYTMRTDMMFEMVKPEEDAKAGKAVEVNQSS